jgi:hypothetical protein
MRRDLTGNLLAAWREAERAAEAAKSLAEKANEAAEAATAAAEAARMAALDAGLSLEAADVAVGKAKDAYHRREANVAAEDELTLAAKQRAS